MNFPSIIAVAAAAVFCAAVYFVGLLDGRYQGASGLYASERHVGTRRVTWTCGPVHK